MSFHRIKRSVNEIVTQEVLFDRNGSAIENSGVKDCYGKMISVDDREKVYLVKVLQHTLYDPVGTYSNRKRFLESGFKRVSKNTFDFYMMYLKTNNSIYLTKAQRGFLND
jgi:hypothetical protein|tara:strand:- start:1536 stop:1865 length:330 start_codon:yes stop_codon:yes gene_type:complete